MDSVGVFSMTMMKTNKRTELFRITLWSFLWLMDKRFGFLLWRKMVQFHKGDELTVGGHYERIPRGLVDVSHHARC